MELETHRPTDGVRSPGVWLGLLALLYALIAGLRTVVDFDLGWQMATGRYLIEQHSLPRTDIFSYTIAGAPWLYPPLSGIAFWTLFRIGGYAAISWLVAAVVITCVAALLYKRGLLAQLLVLITVPVIASEAMPRASLFTMLLLTLMGRLLVEHSEGRRVPLWPLPIVAALWANLHPGFVLVFVLLPAYVLVEAERCVKVSCRAAVLMRLRRAAPWLLASLLAPLFNPFGVHLFRVVLDQRRAIPWQTVLLEEWQPLSLRTMTTELGWRSAESAVWWLLLASVVLAAVLLFKRRIVAPLLLVAAWAAFLVHRRMEGPCVLILCLVAGPALDAWEQPGAWSRLALERRRIVLATTAVLTILLVGVRCFDIVTNRSMLASGEITRFGAGASWWIPQRAVDVLDRFEREHPEAHLFAPFDLGSYLIFRGHKVFADGRAVPFGPALIEEQRRLTTTPLDDPAWTAVAAQYHISMVILPLSRLMALGEAPLAQDCASKTWQPIYMDSTAAIFARRTTTNAAPAQQPQLDCRTVDLLRGVSSSSSFDDYQRTANAAAIYAMLGRVDAAADALDRAHAITTLPDPSLLFVRAQVAAAMGASSQAESLLQQAIHNAPSDTAYYNLALLLASQQRYDEAVAALDRSAKLSREPWQRMLLAGQMLVAARDPRRALDSLDRAQQASPYAIAQSSEAHEFRAAIATGRAQAYVVMGQLSEAIAAQRTAVSETPNDTARQQLLHQLCLQPESHCEK